MQIGRQKRRVNQLLAIIYKIKNKVFSLFFTQNIIYFFYEIDRVLCVDFFFEKDKLHYYEFKCK